MAGPGAVLPAGVGAGSARRRRGNHGSRHGITPLSPCSFTSPSVHFAFRSRGGALSRRGHFAASRRTPGRRRGAPTAPGGRGRPRRAAGAGGGGGPKFAATIASNSARTHAGSASTSSANPSAAAARVILSGIVVSLPGSSRDVTRSCPALIPIAPDGDRFKSSEDFPAGAPVGIFPDAPERSSRRAPRSPGVPPAGPVRAVRPSPPSAVQ